LKSLKSLKSLKAPSPTRGPGAEGVAEGHGRPWGARCCCDRHVYICTGCSEPRDPPLHR
jgi:hypothetical protein